MDPEREQIIYGYKSRFDGGARADFCSHARSLPHTTQALASRADLERATRRGAQFRCDQWRGPERSLLMGEGSPDRDSFFMGGVALAPRLLAARWSPMRHVAGGRHSCCCSTPFASLACARVKRCLYIRCWDHALSLAATSCPFTHVRSTT